MDEKAKLLKASLDAANIKLKEVSNIIRDLKKMCVCQFPPLTQEQLDDKWMSVSSCCLVCGEYHGWRCKVSPDSVCHYVDDITNGEVALLGGKTVPLPDVSHKLRYDECVFCGLPEERK